MSTLCSLLSSQQHGKQCASSRDPRNKLRSSPPKRVNNKYEKTELKNLISNEASSFSVLACSTREREWTMQRKSRGYLCSLALFFNVQIFFQIKEVSLLLALLFAYNESFPTASLRSRGILCCSDLCFCLTHNMYPRFEGGCCDFASNSWLCLPSFLLLLLLRLLGEKLQIRQSEREIVLSKYLLHFSFFREWIRVAEQSHVGKVVVVWIQKFFHLPNASEKML